MKRLFWCGLVVMGLTACQSTPEPAPSPVESASVQAQLFPGWEEKPLPGKRWQPFSPVTVEGLPGLEVRSDASLSLMRWRVQPQVHGPADVSFSWWVHNLLPDADLSDAQASDAPAQVLVAFDGDRSRLSGRFAVMSELTQLVTGEPLPYASLIYVWATGDQHPVGTVITDPRTDRIRYLVVEQGPANLRRWVHHRRDVRADFQRVFGEAPGPIGGLALMSDADNTRGQSRAVFGPVRLHLPPP